MSLLGLMKKKFAASALLPQHQWVDFRSSVLGRILKLGYEPNCATFNTLIRVLCLDGKLAGAVRFLDELARGGFEPNLITSEDNTISQMGNITDDIMELDAAKELLLSLPLKGLQPNTCSYNIMISGLCKEGKLKEANTLFNKMEEKGCLPDGHTYNIIVQAFIWVMR
ncbi:hypothetical protein LguiB_016900 [Lonicera macranthoides]